MTSSAALRPHGAILLVDDSPADLQLLTQLLQSVGYHVCAVNTGQHGLNLARARVPDLILLDVNLPDIGGFEICSLLKADPLTSGVPVIFISAQAEPETKVGAFVAGGVDYVTKPLNPDEVLARVHTHLALRELHLQLQVANAALAERLRELEQSNQQLQAENAARRAAEELSTNLLDQERRRVTRLHALRAAMTDIGSALDPQSLYAVIVDRAAGLLDSTGAALAILPAAAEPLQIHALAGLPPGLVGAEIPPGEGLIGLAVAYGRVVGSADTSTADDPIFRASEALAAPLWAHSQPIGVVAVANPPGSKPFDTEDADLLDLFARQAAIAVENARLFEETRRMAQTDPLTGLLNRRHFYTIATRELERVRRTRGAIAVLMLDLDHFKQVNDGFGHQTGDEVLRSIADVLRSSLRAADVPARYGGEELVVLLPDTNLERAVQAAERIRQAVAATTVATERGSVSLTASVGVAAAHAEQLVESLDQLLARADEALYRAKHLGRNTVAVAIAAA